jgi:hypothetical protein
VEKKEGKNSCEKGGKKKSGGEVLRGVGVQAFFHFFPPSIKTT